MRRNEKTRNAASRALIALREEMGKTQQQFAVEVLDTTVTTMGRYETTHPPRGEVLLTLARIAEESALSKVSEQQKQIRLLALRDAFREMYLEQVAENLGFQLVVMPATRTRLISCRATTVPMTATW